LGSANSDFAFDAQQASIRFAVAGIRCDRRVTSGCVASNGFRVYEPQRDAPKLQVG
jgi:hypothetical protein